MEPYNRLLKYDIKPSAQRIAIMNYLMEHRTHPSADRTYTALSSSMPALSRTTTYNTLRLFSEQEAAQVLTIDERNTSFDGDILQHAHPLCEHRGRIYNLKCQVEVKQIEGLQMNGHEVSEMYYYYKDICKSCLSDIRIG